MGVFPIVKSDAVVQVGDQIRLSAASSFVTPDAFPIAKVEIKPEPSAAFIDVYNANPKMWFLDWIYDSAGTKTIDLKLTQLDNTDPDNVVEVVTTKTQTVRVVTAAEDHLFSTDSDLQQLEPDILQWIPDGYSSWNHIHRQAQLSILDWLNEIRVFKDDGTSYAAADLLNKDQVRRLSTMTALRMIYSILNNQVGDVFADKANEYRRAESNARNRNYIALDVDGSGTVEQSEYEDLRTVSMVRR